MFVFHRFVAHICFLLSLLIKSKLKSHWTLPLFARRCVIKSFEAILHSFVDVSNLSRRQTFYRWSFVNENGKLCKSITFIQFASLEIILLWLRPLLFDFAHFSLTLLDQRVARKMIYKGSTDKVNPWDFCIETDITKSQGRCDSSNGVERKCQNLALTFDIFRPDWILQHFQLTSHLQ